MTYTLLKSDDSAKPTWITFDSVTTNDVLSVSVTSSDYTDAGTHTLKVLCTMTEKSSSNTHTNYYTFTVTLTDPCVVTSFTNSYNPTLTVWVVFGSQYTTTI